MTFQSPQKRNQMANAITLARLPLLLVIVLLLYNPNPIARLINVALVIILIALDTIDGVVARARHETSHLGSVLDVMVDRVVELVLWICFADLRLIPIAIPIICVMRGTIVDSLRSVQVSAGQGPLRSGRTPLAKWLMGSPIMRTSYGAAKLVSFTGLALTHAMAAPASPLAVSAHGVQASTTIFNITSWIAVAFCLVRGLPVVVEAFLAPSLPQTGA
jgi:CDP-diacylglycerol--glycerol-3-phosphate 3-phosphatidyltransferase